MFKNALVSCSDKTGLVDLLVPFQKKGLRIVSTGGTARHLREGGLTVVDVSEQTGFQEVMDGRVKTLHPNIHMALLARDEDPADLETLRKFDLQTFDLVVGNLYPFEEEPTVDNIDIGGPSFLRAAAKNYSRITALCDPNDYALVLKNGGTDIADRKRLAAKVFAHTSAYDSMIAAEFAPSERFDFPDMTLGGRFHKRLRYGENPQQSANWYRIAGESDGIHSAQILQGKELSYNNLLDLDAAVLTLRQFAEPTCIAVKHNNPCGVACGKTGEEALKKCIESDPQSIFGGIVAYNGELTEGMASQLNNIFLECIVTKSISEAAKKKLATKKNVRVLLWPGIMGESSRYSYRSITGGFLTQTTDHASETWGQNWQVFGGPLSEPIQKDLLFAWKVCARLKSNAISVCADEQSLGLGMGQVNRVDSVQQAIERMMRFHPKAGRPVLASDAFFPFPDSIEKIAEAGIKYVIQPGGSIKDEDVKNAAKALGITMVFTGQRHFLH